MIIKADEPDAEIDQQSKNTMGRSLFTLLLSVMFCTLHGQSDVWASWDEEVIRNLNTASSTETLNEEEKKVILFINMARHDGPLFASTFLEAYLAEKGLGRNSYVKSLFRDLKKTSGLSPLQPEPDLTAIARGHASKMGESGRTGHQDFNKRFEPVMGNPYSRVAENCAYGLTEAIDIVLSLMIDDGIKDAGHRKNMLNPLFNSTGVAIRPHKSYRVNCVIDFGSRPSSDLNRVPYQ
jgi:uncharacterized protein YkwD